MRWVAHANAVQEASYSRGPLRARWRDLGLAAGSVEIGVLRAFVEPGARSTPQHRHGREEELVFVLGGSGRSWQDDAAYAIGAGDVLLHRAGEEAHTLIAGDEGLEVLLLGTREADEALYQPRAGLLRFADHWLELPGGPDPWEREAALPDDDVPASVSPRPDRVMAVADAEPEPSDHGSHRFVNRDLGRPLGSRATGLQHQTIAPGCEGFPPHCHAAEEELFIVLSGSGVVVLGDEEAPIHAGSVVARPAGTGVPHSFRAAPDQELVILAYGTRRTHDIVLYARTGVASIRGIRRLVRTEPRPDDYWEFATS